MLTYSEKRVEQDGAGVLEAFAQAIMRQEGWNPGTHAFKNNNPGNLMFAQQRGAVKAEDSGFAKFATFADGWAALKRQITLVLRRWPGITLRQFFGGMRDAEGKIMGYPGYAPAAHGGNRPDVYAQNVERALWAVGSGGPLIDLPILGLWEASRWWGVEPDAVSVYPLTVQLRRGVVTEFTKPEVTWNTPAALQRDRDLLAGKIRRVIQGYEELVKTVPDPAQNGDYKKAWLAYKRHAEDVNAGLTSPLMTEVLANAREPEA